MADAAKSSGSGREMCLKDWAHGFAPHQVRETDNGGADLRPAAPCGLGGNGGGLFGFPDTAQRLGPACAIETARLHQDRRDDVATAGQIGGIIGRDVADPGPVVEVVVGVDYGKARRQGADGSGHVPGPPSAGLSESSGA